VAVAWTCCASLTRTSGNHGAAPAGSLPRPSLPSPLPRPCYFCCGLQRHVASEGVFESVGVCIFCVRECASRVCADEIEGEGMVRNKRVYSSAPRLKISQNYTYIHVYGKYMVVMARKHLHVVIYRT